MRKNLIKKTGVSLLVVALSACGGGGNSDTVQHPMPTKVVLSLTDFEDTGRDRTDFITQDQSFDLSIKADFVYSQVIYQVSKDSGKTWTSTTEKQKQLADGTYQFKVTLKDAAGQSMSSNMIQVTVDRTAPILEKVNLINVDTQRIGTSDQSLISGQTEKGMLIKIKADQQQVNGAPLISNSLGQFQLEIPARIQGESIEVQAEDLAGNLSQIQKLTAPMERSIYSDIDVSELSGVYQLSYQITKLEKIQQYLWIDQDGIMTILNDKNSSFYTQNLKNPQNCYGLPEVGTPNWTLQGKQIYKKQPESKTYFINVNGVEYKFDQNLDYLHDDGVLARYMSNMPADINYGAKNWVLFPFAKSNLTAEALQQKVCSNDQTRLKKMIHPALVDARSVAGLFKSNDENQIVYTQITENGKFNIYSYDQNNKCYKHPNNLDVNFSLDQQYLQQDQSKLFIYQPYGTTGFGATAFVKIMLNNLTQQAVKAEGNYGEIFLSDAMGKFKVSISSPNIYKPEHRSLILGGQFEQQMTQQQLEQQKCK